MMTSNGSPRHRSRTLATARRQARRLLPAAVAIALALWLLLTLAPPKQPDSSEAAPSGTTAALPADSPAAPASRAPSRPPAEPLREPSAPESHDDEPDQTTQALQVVLRASWGSGPGSLGTNEPPEGAQTGPMSFAQAPCGALVVLDQANNRLKLFPPGRSPHSLSLPPGWFEDVALTNEGAIMLLDRLGEGRIVHLTPDGALSAETPLEGPLIATAGGVTGLVTRPDGAWVEVERRRMVHVAKPDGTPVENRTMLPGRPTHDGLNLLSAAIEPPGVVALFSKSAGPHNGAGRVLARPAFELPPLGIVLLEPDSTGRIFLVVHTALFESEAPFAVVREMLELVLLAADGRELARTSLRPGESGLEQFRKARLGADGTLYVLLCDEHGATMMGWQP